MKKYFTYFVLNYLRLLAKVQIAKIRLVQKIRGKSLTIVGITGSAGKSSTINACQAALQDYFTVKTTAGSNSESGIPLNILNIGVGSFSPVDWVKYCLLAIWSLIANWKTYDIYLVEMGIDGPDSPKNMSYLLSIVQPTIGIFLNVNLTHSEQFDKTVSSSITGDQRKSKIIAAIGAEKSKLVNSLPPSGLAIINNSDPTVLNTTLTLRCQKILIKPISIHFDKYAPPADFDISISAAVNLAKHFKLDEKSIITSIKNNLILPPSRSSLLKGINNSTIIDSSYNSSPLATEAMLQVLKKITGTKVAILGDMRELGIESKNAHTHLYEIATKCADTIICVGKETQQYFGDKSTKFTYWWQASDYLLANPQLIEQSTILIKGSQNTIYLEEVVKSLLQDKSETKLLCRQSSHWQKVKSEFRQSSQSQVAP